MLTRKLYVVMIVLAIAAATLVVVDHGRRRSDLVEYLKSLPSAE